MPEDGIKSSFGRAMRWIDSHLAQFAFDIDDSPDRQLVLLKPFSELLLALYLLKRAGVDAPALDRHLRWAWDKTEQGDVFFRLLIARPDFYQLALPVACLKHAGLENDRLLRLLDEIAELKTFCRVESEQWVTISVRYAYQLLGHARLQDADFASCWLMSRPEPWLITHASAYAFTHEVFYLTDFGANRSAVSPAVAAYIDCWTPVWMAAQQERRNWDLMAEFAMVGQCLRLPWADAALASLAGAQEPDGSFAGPPHAGANLKTANDSAARAAFLSTYHTTLVAALALSGCCRSRR